MFVNRGVTKLTISISCLVDTQMYVIRPTIFCLCQKYVFRMYVFLISVYGLVIYVTGHMLAIVHCIPRYFILYGELLVTVMKVEE